MLPGELLKTGTEHVVVLRGKTKPFQSSTSPCVFVFPTDCSSLLYVVQQQPLGSIQWSVVASNLRETNYTVTSLSKGVRYAFRVLASTGKTLSKPSLSTDLVQLLDRGKQKLREVITSIVERDHIQK